MKATRTLEELYEFVYDNMKLLGQPSIEGGRMAGICDIIFHLHKSKKMSNEEYNLVYNNFQQNKPTKELHTAFFNHEQFTDKFMYWWADDNHGQRILFSEYLINNHII